MFECKQSLPSGTDSCRKVDKYWISIIRCNNFIHISVQSFYDYVLSYDMITVVLETRKVSAQLYHFKSIS